MRNIDKIVESQYPPKQTNVLWFDTTTSELKIYMNGEWVHADGLDEIATDEDIDSITKEEFDKRQYFTIETISDNTKLSWLLPLSAESSFGTNIEWSSNEGANWQVVFSRYDAEGNIGTFDAGTKIIFRHDGPTGFDDNDGSLGDYAGSFFYANKPCYVYGNAMSLLFSSDFATQDDVKYDYALTNLFSDGQGHSSSWVRFKEGSPLLLPATKLTNNCYACMFTNCLSITTAPELPATTLAFECYRAMFVGCASLTTPPELPATTLADACYSDMFHGCTSLTSAPVLPATTLVGSCYSSMFNDCTSLMSVKCLASAVSPSNAVSYWLNNVSATGTFTKSASVSWSSGASGIPSGWTVIEE